MVNFRTSARHLITQLILFISVIVLTIISKNFKSIGPVPILIIIDIAIFLFCLSSLFRKATLDGDILTAKSLIKTSDVNITKIKYAQALSAFGRLVVILNDGEKTVVLTSLLQGLNAILNKVRPHLNEEDYKRLEVISDDKIKSKKMLYDTIMVIMIIIVWYGIIKTYLHR